MAREMVSVRSELDMIDFLPLSPSCPRGGRRAAISAARLSGQFVPYLFVWPDIRVVSAP
jgi:hypothetical protein